MRTRIPAALLALALALASPALTPPAVAMGSDSGPAKPAENAAFTAGKGHIKAGKYAEAIPALEQAVEAEPKNADAWNLLGFAHRKTSNFPQALEAYQKALAIEPAHRGANEYLGQLYLQTGQLDKAKERLQVLDGACLFGCEEYTSLKRAIESYGKTGGLPRDYGRKG